MEISNRFVNSSKNGLAYFLMLLVCIAFHSFLQLQDIRIYSYSPDEWIHIHMATADSVQEVLRFSKNETHPPLGNIIRYFWMQADNSVESVRLLSMLFLYFTVIASYLCGRAYGGNAVGFIVAYIMLFSHASMSLSFVVRNYTIAEFFTVLAYYCYLQIRLKSGNRWRLAYIVCAICSMLVNYSVIYLFFSVGLIQFFIYVKDRQKQQLVPWIITNLIVGLSFISILLLTMSWVSTAYLKEAVLLYNQYAQFGPVERVLYAIVLEFMAVIYGLKPVFLHGYIVDILLFLILLVVWFVPTRYRQESYIIILLIFLCAILNIAGLFPYASYRHLYFLVIPSMLLAADLVYTNTLRFRFFKNKIVQGLLLLTFTMVPLSVISDPQKGTDYEIGWPAKLGTLEEDAGMRKALADLNKKSSVIFLPKMQAFTLFAPPPSLYKSFPKEADATYRLVEIQGYNVALNAGEAWLYNPANFFKRWDEFVKKYDVNRYSDVVFFKTVWGDENISALFKCPALQVQTLYHDDKNMALFKVPMELMLKGTGKGSPLHSCFKH